MTDEERTRIAEIAAAQLGEHFDAVQILVSWNEEATTRCLKRGCGNWYARQGMAHEFVNAELAEEYAQRVRDVLPEPERPDDDGESWKGEQP